MALTHTLMSFWNFGDSTDNSIIYTTEFLKKITWPLWDYTCLLNRPLDIKAFLADTLIVTEVKHWFKTVDFPTIISCCSSATVGKIAWSSQHTWWSLVYFFLQTLKSQCKADFPCISHDGIHSYSHRPWFRPQQYTEVVKTWSKTSD